MKNISNIDSCTIGSSVDEVKVSVIFRGATTGTFSIERNGIMLPPNPDRTVPLGKANTLPGTSILVRTLVNQIGPGPFLEVDYVLQGTMCGPFNVKDTFDAGDPVLSENSADRLFA
jgi:hypothetical protein